MNQPCSGSVLLVGEGDFSLSVALNKQLRDVCLVSSALLDENNIQIHKKAVKNIEILRSAGAVVHLALDATKLEEDKRVSANKFSRIVFNFPHIGGKSNIKRNRELLRNFFRSAVHCLMKEGDICVSLCRGQGGTAADVPMRQWSDSWQVVAMAAYSDLILSNTVPFVAEDFPEYSCTGFRSRDQFFHTKGAVTHVFRRVTPTRLPSDLISCGTVKLDGNVYDTNTYIEAALTTMNEIESLKYHPVTAACELIEKGLKDLCEATTPIYLELPYLVDSNGNISNHYLLYKHKPGKLEDDGVTTEVKAATSDPSHHKYLAPCENSSQKIGCQICVATSNEGEISKRVCPVYCRDDVNKDQLIYLLRSNLLESFTSAKCFTNLEENRLYVAKGDTYHRCSISLNETPQHYEIAICQKNTNIDDFQSLTRRLFQAKLSIDELHCKVVGNEDMLLHGQYVKTIFSLVHVSYIWYSNIEKDCLSNVPCNLAYDICGHGGEGSSSNNCGSHGNSDRIPFAFVGSLKKDPSIQVCLCVVDSLSRSLYSISDARLLWSKSPELRKHYFQQRPQENVAAITPFSMYAPEWKHDISFWQDTEVEFDELTYMDVVRDHLGDCVKEVLLMNVWTPEGENRTSRCYRQLHQPNDQAVSYHRAHEFQRLLRLKVAHVFNVDLR